MSQTAAMAFIERMKKDEAFKTKILAVSNLDARIKLIQSEGFDCTADELLSFASELSDDQVAAVAGGSGTGRLTCPCLNNVSGRLSCI
jgi:predicted ribosomally synthesized peptide with nif11-like leader